jgi:hypothetical protein
MFMRFYAIFGMASLVLCDELQQQESPNSTPDASGKQHGTTPAEIAPRAQPVDDHRPSSIGNTEPKMGGHESQGSGSGTPEPPSSPRQANTPPPENSAELHFTTMNEVIVDVLVGMPKGGGYDASPAGVSLQMLGSAIRLEANRLVIEPEKAEPSYCSSATYLVFLSVLDRLNREGHLTISPQVMEKLLVRGQGDGVGIWGRWNANGPGTARLFEQLNLGKNFTSFEEARPGDFLKIFWSEDIGSKESGHSVIFLGLGSPNEKGDQTIVIWSSNRPDGYGRKEVPISKIKHAVFSRLEDPRKIEGALTLPTKDAYLAALQKRSSTVDEMLQKINLPADAMPKPAQATPTVQLPRSNLNTKDERTSALPSNTPASGQEGKVREDTHNSPQQSIVKDQDKSGANPSPTNEHP